MTVYFNPSATDLIPNPEYGVGFNGESLGRTGSEGGGGSWLGFRVLDTGSWDVE